MKIVDLHSKRKTRSERGTPEEYQYTDVPNALRVQIVHMWKAGFGEPTDRGHVPELFAEIHGVLCREYGLFNLTNKREPVFTKVANFMLESKDADQVLDIVELTFNALEKVVRPNPRKFASLESVDAIIEELNARFREHNLGYKYEYGRLVRLEASPALDERRNAAPQPLVENAFEGANPEYLSAQDHYNRRHYEECLSDCSKAFERTMRLICAKRGWNRDDTATSKQLLEILFQHGLISPPLQNHFGGSHSPFQPGFIPLFLQNHFQGLRSTLEAGVPMFRNKSRGPGRARNQLGVTDYMAAYALRVTAAGIQFLVQADRAFDTTESSVSPNFSPLESVG